MLARILTLGLFLLLIQSCSSSNSSGGGGTLTASTKLVSTTLSSRTSAGLSQAVHPCPTGTHTCITPSNIAGKLIKNMMRVSSGEAHINITTAESGDLSKVGADTTLKDFDFQQGLTFSGAGTISQEFTGQSSFKDALMFFDYIDITFTAPTMGIATARTLRLVFATDEVRGYTRGDVLIKDGSDYKWCATGTTSLTQCSTTRPTTPIVNTQVRDYSEAGSPTVPYFTTEVFATSAGTELVTTSFSALNGKTWTFTLDFDATNTLAVPNGSYSNVFEVMPLILIRGMSSQVSSAGQGIAAVLTATAG